jgi:hypothetical protein
MKMPRQRRPRVSLSVRIPADLAERVRTCCRDQAGRPLYLTLSSFSEAAFEAQLDVVERQLSGDLPTRRRLTDNAR